MTTSTLTAIIYKQGQPAVVEALELDDPGPGEVMVKIGGTGVCHSDHNVYSGYRKTETLPAILGHEGAGTVEKLGTGVHGLDIGDKVVFAIRPMCGKCKYCSTGRWNLCNPISGYTPTAQFRKNATKYHGGMATFTEHTVVWENNVVKVDPDIPIDKAALVGCAVITGVGAVVNRAKVETGSTVAVWGCGGVGLNVIQGAHISGASRIIAVDNNPAKFQYATKLGATDTIDASTNNAVETIRELTSGGVDYAFEVIGQPATLRQALEATCEGGTAILVGAAPDNGEVMIPMRHLFLDRALIGCSAGSASPRHDFQWLIALYQQGRLNLDDLVTQTRPLTEVNEAFRDMEAGAVARTVLLP